MKTETAFHGIWISLGMASRGNQVETTPADAAEIAELKSAGLICGAKWVKLTRKGQKRMNQTSG